MGKHYSRKRFNPGQKHALNDKLREAERKRRPIPSLDTWMDSFDFGAVGSNMRPNAYKGQYDRANENYWVARDDAEDEDGLDDVEGYELPEEKQGYLRQDFNWAYGEPGSEGGDYGNPETALGDYDGDKPEDNMGSAWTERMDELVHKGKASYYRANARSAANSPLLIRDVHRYNKKAKEAQAQGEQSEKNATHLERIFRKEHKKPAFDSGYNTGYPKSPTIGEITVPKGQEEAYGGAKFWYQKNKDKFNK